MKHRQDARTIKRTHAEGEPQQFSKRRFNEVGHNGEGPLSGTRMEFINRKDTDKQLLTGGPVILNKGENIFTTYPRRVNEGETIRSEEDER